MNTHSFFRGALVRSLSRSQQHFQLANTKLPLGVSSNFRYWGDDKTIYVERGKGARIWDIDGNEYIDYRLAYGPIILGYGDPRVDEAARNGIEVGGVFALSTELEYDVACRVSKMVPAAELVRFSNSGTEAVMAALRVARAFTGKDAHIVVEGGYHGVFSEVMWYSEVEDWTPGQGDPEVMPYGDGVPAVTKQLFHTVPLNDANALEDLLNKKHNEIGAFLIEPIMRHIGDGVVHGGTFTAHSVSLAAAAKTLEILDESSALADIESYGLSLQEGLSRILTDRGVVHSFTGHPALMGLFFAEVAPTNYREWVKSNYEFYDALAPELHEQGILVEPDSREPWFLCESHNMGCLDETLDKFKCAVDITLPKLEQKRSSSAGGGPIHK
jgi:glutamate-1-semialdehyde aminotransferase